MCVIVLCWHKEEGWVDGRKKNVLDFPSPGQWHYLCVCVCVGGGFPMGNFDEKIHPVRVHGSVCVMAMSWTCFFLLTFAWRLSSNGRGLE